MTMAMLTRRATLSRTIAALTTGIALGGVAAAKVPFATPEPAKISPQLTSLIAAVAVAEAKLNEHSQARVSCASFTKLADEAQQQHIQESNDLCDAWCAAEHRVAAFPVNSAADLQAKLSFMIEREMFDGVDWSAELLADATHLAAKEG